MNRSISFRPGRERGAAAGWSPAAPSAALVHHHRGHLIEEFVQHRRGVAGQLHLVEAFVISATQRARAAGVTANGMCRMQPARVPPLLDVARRTAEAADEEVAQALLGAGQRSSGGSSGRGGRRGDLAVERGDEAREAVLADRGVDVGVVHWKSSCVGTRAWLFAHDDAEFAEVSDVLAFVVEVLDGT